MPHARARAHRTHTHTHTPTPTPCQLANISAHTDTMISGLKQSVSKDGGEMGTPTLLVLAYTRTHTLARTSAGMHAHLPATSPH